MHWKFLEILEIQTNPNKLSGYTNVWKLLKSSNVQQWETMGLNGSFNTHGIPKKLAARKCID